MWKSLLGLSAVALIVFVLINNRKFSQNDSREIAAVAPPKLQMPQSQMPPKNASDQVTKKSLRRLDIKPKAYDFDRELHQATRQVYEKTATPAALASAAAQPIEAEEQDARQIRDQRKRLLLRQSSTEMSGKCANEECLRAQEGVTLVGVVLATSGSSEKNNFGPTRFNGALHTGDGKKLPLVNLQ